MVGSGCSVGAVPGACVRALLPACHVPGPGVACVRLSSPVASQHPLVALVAVALAGSLVCVRSHSSLGSPSVARCRCSSASPAGLARSCADHRNPAGACYLRTNLATWLRERRASVKRPHLHAPRSAPDICVPLVPFPLQPVRPALSPMTSPAGEGKPQEARKRDPRGPQRNARAISPTAGPPFAAVMKDASGSRDKSCYM